MRVSYQGEPGAFSEAAVLEYFGSEVLPQPQKTFQEVFTAVESGDCDAGMVPIENSLAGSIHENYDRLVKHTLWVVGEHFLRVRHCLIALPGVNLSEIRRVISHPQALAQCDGYLAALKNVTSEPVYDTAGSVKIVKEQGDRSVAAIASQRAAVLYGMQILKEGIEDNSANHTRFLIISQQPAPAGVNYKTSIVFSLRNQPGSLFKAMSVFALRDIDLTKIESRPLVGTPWDYLFYIDFAGCSADDNISRALNHLNEYATMMRILGSYPRQIP
ncbi:MAG: prephenate dehydratase [Anaerolineaceae bacterium]|nr:prephenate dehydratase [Anaerolineaceae bacterium]